MRKMTKPTTDNKLDNFRQRVLMAVYAIPFGKVATYGEIAKQAGSVKAARQVGGILKHLPADSKLPWFRVVNRFGKLSLIGDEYQCQYHALKAEGIVFGENDTIDLQLFGWFI